ncbi:uncharacterized protein LOC122372380 [Amphibalanus amphitrite]|uniref:uncharacterized protein LOC122372380 n=1 Tax=Amphibalanus amphitrite TaxID=1232801 RepID=UPI001C917365|nr:uncharacterized protein LOC122372380 [Amphibalanus amphitrite]
MIEANQAMHGLGFVRTACLLISAWLPEITSLKSRLEAAGIVKAEGNAFVKQFHTNPDAFLGWEVHSDGTIWFDLDCMDLDELQYCGFGFSETDQPAGTHHDTDVYIAHRRQVEDRYSASNWSTPRLDQHQDVSCDHCAVLDGRLHATFFRNLSTGDVAQDVSIVNRTYRVSWAIGVVRDGRVSAHNFTPRAESEYMYINFLEPEATEMPKFEVHHEVSAAGALQMVMTAVLGFALLCELLS